MPATELLLEQMMLLKPQHSMTAQQVLSEMLDFILSKNHPINHIAASKRGLPVLDYHFPPNNPGDLHNVYSCTKSVLSLLIGIALDQHLIDSVDQSITEFLPISKTRSLERRWDKITLKHLLTMTSGLDFRDHGDTLSTYFATVQSEDLVASILATPQKHVPGSTFHYNNSGSHLLCYALKAATQRNVLEFADEFLFSPLGIKDFRWNQHPQTNVTGWTGLYLTTRDLLKISNLVLNGGTYCGTHVVSEGWVNESTKLHIDAFPYGKYGYHWWVEPECVQGVGHFGQYLFVRPDEDICVAVCSSLAPGNFLIPKYLLQRFLLPAVRLMRHDDPLERSNLQRLHRKHISAVKPAPINWRSSDEGTFCNGVFRRNLSPSFNFRCSRRVSPISSRQPHRVFAARTIEGFPIIASVRDIPFGIALSSIGDQLMEKITMRYPGPTSQLETGREHRFDDGTTGCFNQIQYQWDGNTCTAVFLSAYRDNKWICLEGHTMDSPEEMISIIESLSFDERTDHDKNP